jgi:hypothetical protein
MANDTTDLESELDLVFGASPDTFTSVRDTLVKKLKSEKRKDDAAIVAALRRPTALLWGMNQVARADGDPIRELRRLGQLALRAQEQMMSGGSPTEVLAAVEQRRVMVSALVNSVVAYLVERGTAAEVLAPQLRSAFEMVSVNAAASAALQRGRLPAIPTAADETADGSAAPPRGPRHLSVVREEAVAPPQAVTEAPAEPSAKPAAPEVVEVPVKGLSEVAVAEGERLASEASVANAAEKERAEKERAEKERVELQQVEQERLEKERAEKERAEKERTEKEQAEALRVEQERFAGRQNLEREVAEAAQAVQQASELVSKLSVAAVVASNAEQQLRTRAEEEQANLESLQAQIAATASELARASDDSARIAAERAAAEAALSEAMNRSSSAASKLRSLS